METLNDQDLDWLISVQAKLIRLRKREAANAARLDSYIGDAIEQIDMLRSMLAARLGRAQTKAEGKNS